MLQITALQRILLFVGAICMSPVPSFGTLIHNRCEFVTLNYR